MMLMLKSTRFMIQIRMRDLRRGKGKGSVLMMKNHHIRFFVLILNLWDGANIRFFDRYNIVGSFFCLQE